MGTADQEGGAPRIALPTRVNEVQHAPTCQTPDLRHSLILHVLCDPAAAPRLEGIALAYRLQSTNAACSCESAPAPPACTLIAFRRPASCYAPPLVRKVCMPLVYVLVASARSPSMLQRDSICIAADQMRTAEC